MENTNGAEIMAMPIDVDDKGFDSFIDSEGLTVVEFWDPWCSICAEMAPIYEALSTRYGGKAKFGKLNMRENKKMADLYEVYITPTFIFFRKGKEISRLGGLLQPNELEIELEKQLSQ